MMGFRSGTDPEDGIYVSLEETSYLNPVQVESGALDFSKDCKEVLPSAAVSVFDGNNRSGVLYE